MRTRAASFGVITSTTLEGETIDRSVDHRRTLLSIIALPNTDKHVAFEAIVLRYDFLSDAPLGSWVWKKTGGRTH